MYCAGSIVVSIASNVNIVYEKNSSYKKILNKSGPKIEPCRTPNNISSQELKVLIIFIR